MSLWKFGNFEADVDFTDVDFLDAIERAYDILEEDAKSLPVDGRPSAIARAQIECYDRFFENIFGEGVCNQMFDSMSLERRLDAVEQLAKFREKEDSRFNDRVSGYTVKKPNRAERRASQKNQQRWNAGNRGNRRN